MRDIEELKTTPIVIQCDTREEFNAIIRLSGVDFTEGFSPGYCVRLYCYDAYYSSPHSSSDAESYRTQGYEVVHASEYFQLPYQIY